MPYQSTSAAQHNWSMNEADERSTTASSSAGRHVDRTADPPGEHATHLGPVDTCPDCGSRDFDVQNRDDTVIFVCEGCKVAWRYELSYVWPVSVE